MSGGVGDDLLVGRGVERGLEEEVEEDLLECNFVLLNAVLEVLCHSLSCSHTPSAL